MTTTLLQTDLSRSPYFDDYDQTVNYYKVLYKPATAVQVRELNTAQSIMQDQIDKFGRSVYKEGSVVEGCSFTFDNNYNYVKINDNFTNNFSISTTSQFVGDTLVNQYGLTALIVNFADGFQSDTNENLNTFYIKYLNTATKPYPNGVFQSVYANTDVLTITSSANVSLGNVVVATVVNSVGRGYAVSVTEGVIFKKGFFIRVAPQTYIVSKYNNYPDNISLGFDAQEVIVGASSDTSLFDNAAGSPNYDAPGADRLKLVPNLITVSTASVSSSASFFSLVDFKQGLPITLKTDPQYTSLSKELARRTYETNGNYVVNPFLLSTQNKTQSDSYSNTGYLNLISSAGVGYVQGYRVEFINNNNVNLRRGTDLSPSTPQTITGNFGYYVNVNQYCGDFDNFQAVKVEIHSAAKQAITSKSFLGVTYTAPTKIGTAFIRGLTYASGTPGVDAVYRLYLFNIQMNPGYNFSQAQSIIYYNGGTINAVADIVLSLVSVSGTTSYIAQIQDPLNEIMIHPFGQKALSSGGFGTSSYVLRDRVIGNTSAAAFNSSGVMTIPLSGVQQFVYNTSPSSLTPTQEATFNVVPLSQMLAGNSSNQYKTGTIAVSSTTTTITGTSSAFTSEYTVGDYLYVSGVTKRITSISSATSMTVDSVYGSTTSGLNHQKIYPTGVPINFTNSAARSIIATSTTATLNLGGEYITNTSGSAVSTNCSVYFDVSLSGLNAAKKKINRSTLISINTATHPNGTVGPWSLGIPDVLNLNHVYVGASASLSNPDIMNAFRLDNGQRDSYYDLASISTNSPLPKGSVLVVSVDNFTIDTSYASYGFFTANSYPIDDANTANTNAIKTAQIPQYLSINTKNIIDLRDSVDFRPYMANTANAIANTIGTMGTNPATASSVYLYNNYSTYLLSPDTNFSTTLQYYLPRVDSVALTTSGSLIITEGTPSVTPFAPAEIPGTMTIGIVSVPAYPSLTPSDAAKYNRYDYAVQMTLQQTKRYTMADIGKLDNRITTLEYYTSLNLLEQSASSLLVRSSVTGQNRFQNGILVDPFKDHSIGNTNDPYYRIAVDTNRGEARPRFTQTTIPLFLNNSLSTPNMQTGSIVTMPVTGTSKVPMVQFASSLRNCVEGNIYNWTGTITLDPPGTVDPDVTTGPQVIGNLDLSQNWTNLANAWGTQWGNWTNIGSPTVTNSTTAAAQTGSTTNTDGSITNSYQTQTTTTTTQQTQQIGQQITVTPATSTVTLGNYVTNVSILPYIKTTTVFFRASGLKPNTPLFAFFNSEPVSNFCMPVTPYTGTTQLINNQLFTTDASPLPLYADPTLPNTYYSYVPNNWGSTVAGSSNLITDSSGNVYGAFVIPDRHFKAGQLQFMLVDTFSLALGVNAGTTSASATYFASPISIQQNQVALQVQNPQISSMEVINNSSVQQVATTTTINNTIIPPTPLPVYIPVTTPVSTTTGTPVLPAATVTPITPPVTPTPNPPVGSDITSVDYTVVSATYNGADISEIVGDRGAVGDSISLVSSALDNGGDSAVEPGGTGGVDFGGGGGAGGGAG